MLSSFMNLLIEPYRTPFSSPLYIILRLQCSICNILFHTFFVPWAFAYIHQDSSYVIEHITAFQPFASFHIESRQENALVGHMGFCVMQLLSDVLQGFPHLRLTYAYRSDHPHRRSYDPHPLALLFALGRRILLRTSSLSSMGLSRFLRLIVYRWLCRLESDNQSITCYPSKIGRNRMQSTA